MKRYQAGMHASRGYYLNRTTWEIQALPKKGGPLPGPAKSSYIRLPIPIVVVPFFGAFLGGLFVLLIPFIAIPALLWLLGVKGWKKLTGPKARLVERRRES